MEQPSPCVTPDTSADHAGGGKWQFDQGVTACFDDMLSRSIPQYDVMRAACFAVGRRFVQPRTAIMDIGCSRGAALAPFVDHFGAANRFVGLDVSDPMLQAARERFAGMIRCNLVDIRKHDLRTGLPPVRSSVILSVLTLQFTPIEYRQKIVADAYEWLAPGGAFILVEKILGSSATMDRLLVDAYYEKKADSGYSQEQIQRKRLSLEGVLVPVTAAWNEELLRQAGFEKIDCFWRWMNFAGWVAVRRA